MLYFKIGIGFPAIWGCFWVWILLVLVCYLFFIILRGDGFGIIQPLNVPRVYNHFLMAMWTRWLIFNFWLLTFCGSSILGCTFSIIETNIPKANQFFHEFPALRDLTFSYQCFQAFIIFVLKIIEITKYSNCTTFPKW